MDIILLYILKKVNKKKSSMLRIIGAAAVGATMACVVGVFIWMSAIFRFFLVYIASSLLMVLIAFGRLKIRDLLKQIIALYFITYFVGGFMNSIYYHTNLRSHMIKLGRGLIYSDISWKFVVLAIVFITPIIIFSYWFYRWYCYNAPETYDVELILENRSIHTRGLMDTGNCLYDPLYHKPVMLVENTVMDELLTPEFQQDLEEAKRYVGGNDTSQWNINADHVLRLRFVPYQSIGKTGMLVGLILDKVLIHTGKETICNEKVTAAICDRQFSPREDYHVILHKELL